VKRNLARRATLPQPDGQYPKLITQPDLRIDTIKSELTLRGS
jgi:hypothetical protein